MAGNLTAFAVQFSQSEARAVARPALRDARIDFFRGLALFCIFADHMHGNALGWITLRNFGFADAAEVFVLLAGSASFMAYGKTFEKCGWRCGTLKVARRIRDLYLAHIVLVTLCVGGLLAAAYGLGNEVYLNHANLAPVVADPSGSIMRALALIYQPGYLDILPLYMMLLAWFPVLLWLIRRHVALALAISIALWAGAGTLQWNLPNVTDSQGWYFNPFAWQLLFSLGAIAGSLSANAPLKKPRGLLWVGAAYVAFAFILKAPWTNLPALAGAIVLPLEIVGDVSKQYLSLWRLAHIAALAYVIAAIVQPGAAWLTHPIARAFITCGRQALTVFCVGTVLSLAGFVVLAEIGCGLICQIGVNVVGAGLLLFAARTMDVRKGRSSTRPLQARQLSPDVQPLPKVANMAWAPA
jgi:hypothetical protein